MAASQGEVARHGVKTRSIGLAIAIGHHGELIQGVFEGEKARLHRVLVTLPALRLKSEARFETSEITNLTVDPAHKAKAAAAARLTLDLLKTTDGGTLSIKSSIPVGRGYGSSTADVVAAIRAVSSAHEVQ